MNKWAILALRVVLVLALCGSLVAQIAMTPLLRADLAEASVPGRVSVPFVVIWVLGIATIQVCALSVWQLLTMVRRGKVFSSASFRCVDVIIGAIGTAALLVFALGVILAPGEAVAPGVVLLIGGLGLILVGVALVVVVMRALLAQAVARDAEARALQGELDEVI